jgi:hypothetical protein
MQPLCGEVDRIVRIDRGFDREIFLAAVDGPSDRGFEATIDPYFEIERVCKCAFDYEYTFEKDDVDVFETVSMPTKFGGRLLGEIHC